MGPAELACRGKGEKGCSPFPTGAHAHHGLRDGERLTVSEGRKEAGPFPSDIPRARKPIMVDNSQWKERPWERAPKKPTPVWDRSVIPARRRPWPTNDGSHANQACSICG